MVQNLAILLLIAVVLAALALALFSALGRVERRAHWGRRREDGIRRGQRLERRAFLVGLALVIALAGGLVATYLLRRPGCSGTIVIVRGPGGEPLECVCEHGRRGECWSPGP